MRYVGFQDLRKRWPLYTKMGLHKVVRRDDFPSPLFTVDDGKTRIWDERDIELYEAVRPEMTNAEQKRQKRVRFAICHYKKVGQARPAP